MQRRYSREQDPDLIIERLRDLEILYDVSPDTLPIRIKEERQYLRQIQQDIDVHRYEHLQAQDYAARLAAKTEEEKTKLQEYKEKAIVLTQMRHREKQARAWKKIS